MDQDTLAKIIMKDLFPPLLSRLTCLILVEIPLLFCITAISLAHSLNTAIGLALTCSAFEGAEFEGSDDEKYEGR